MGLTRREFLAMAGSGAAFGLVGCSSNRSTTSSSSSSNGSSEEEPASEVNLEEFQSLALDMGAWKYDEENDVYYQLGLAYCTSPATKTYESLAIFVPGAYFAAEENGSTWRCEIDSKAIVGNFTPSTAPVLMPINTGTLSAQMSPTAYSYAGLAPYLQAGCVYVYAGFRGRSAGYDTASGSGELFPGGSPWPVVDMKAAVRYLRYNASELPFNADRIFTFGFSAGGGVSAVLGSSGNSELYAPYLESIGAATHDAEGNTLSDAVCGSASWCPSTSFDMADAAYEWAAGQYASTGTRAEGTWTQALSQGLAGSYAAWINQMDLRGDDDAQLTLDESEAGVYAMGSYATALLSNVNDAANYFLQNTGFPYTYTPTHLDDPSFPGDPNLSATRAADAAASSAAPTTAGTSAESAASGDATTETTETLVDDGSGAVDVADAADAEATATEADASDSADASEDADTSTTTADEGQDADMSATSTTEAPALTGVQTVQSTIFDSAQNYFAALNSDYWWINYNLRRQTVDVSSLRDFSLHLRPADLDACPYDRPDRSSRTNQLFGIDDESTLHFDAQAEALVDENADTYATLEGFSTTYGIAWANDLKKVDSLKTTMEQRVAMMNPLYWLSGCYEGYGQADVAPNWRINEGLFDTDVPLPTAANLVLALRKYDGASVMYTPVWGQGHVLAERSGSATTNLLNWVVDCCA